VTGLVQVVPLVFSDFILTCRKVFLVFNQGFGVLLQGLLVSLTCIAIEVGYPITERLQKRVNLAMTLQQ
jgi:hypothetical protein